MSAFIVAVPLGAMDASGSGTIESQQHTSAIHTDITHEFRTSLSKTSDLFTAFSWADVNTEGEVGSGSGQTDFTIQLNPTKFAGALKAVIEQALGGKADTSFTFITNQSSVPAAKAITAPSNLGSGTTNAQTILDREIRLEVEGELDANGVLEYLEGDSLGNFSLVLDASGGANDMATKMNVNAVLRNLFLQLPNRDSQVSMTDASGSRLPVAPGDAIAFVFSVTPTVLITQVDETADAVGDSAGAQAPNVSTPNMDVNGAIALSTGTRKIAFVVEVTA